MNNISFKKVNFTIIKAIITAYQNYAIHNTDSNKANVFNKNGIIITIYKTNSVLFQGYQGYQAEKEAKRFFPTLTSPLPNKNVSIPVTYFQKDVIGNDEVGVGDIFGPLVVTASYLPLATFNELTKLPIKDSKKMTKQQILSLAPIIKKMVKSVTIIINNELYNKWYTKYQNAHIIKTLAHNQALVQLLTKHQLNNKTIFIDQFVNQTKYFEYLQKTKTSTIIKDNLDFNFNFITKGEEKSLAIACSAILSRAAFLIKINELETKYHLSFPLGASENVKARARKYKEMLPATTYTQFLKEHFNLTKK
ncbi:ribonuclease HIII [Spiroplasma endosymbiont of Poecilobothrus nobilitatus]|uniref:ribonuclease HIII n=1 Tax=Spiroplasma endosymbiont of Poecilobothrus nobilitatus TaxID=1209220 RepID=UPI00313AF63D